MEQNPAENHQPRDDAQPDDSSGGPFSIPQHIDRLTLPYNRLGSDSVNRVEMLGVPVDGLRLADILALLQECLSEPRRCLVAHANITGLNLAYEQPWLRDFYHRCDLVYPDGMGVLLGARLLSGWLPERFTLADWIWPLAQMVAAHGWSMYLLGNPPGVAERAADRLQGRFPGLRIAGTHHGFFDKTPGQADNETVIAHINASRADLLLVGFGMPVQEAWLNESWPRLSPTVAMTVGALFEYISGDLQRGPGWMTGHYLEWLARALLQPRRYARRYLRDLPRFAWRIWKQRWTVEI